MPFLRLTTAASLITAFVTVSTVQAQTIFTYGNKPVTRNEFLKAYNKNNTGEQPTDKSYREYLELYTRFKIKVQAALDMKLDTLPTQLAELNSFRNQVVENYMNDETSVNLLVDEAMERSRKDIHLAHIFVAARENATAGELKQASDKIDEAMAALQRGEDFGQTALRYSEDPAVKNNQGDLGYITALVLPYDLETLVYSLAPGKTGKIRSKIGFHIFKNLGERKAIGRIRTAQILLGIPPDANPAQKAALSQKADSIYQALLKGSDFKALAAQFSSDNISYQAGGEMKEFGVGSYEPAFEATAFALEKDGDISKPVLTEFGYHIIKRLQRMPVPDGTDAKQWRDQIKNQVEQSDRMQVARNILYKKILQLTGFKKIAVNEKELDPYTDSILLQKRLPKMTLTENTPLFSFTKQTMRVKDWRSYLESMLRLANTRSRPHKQLMDEFIERSAFDYYRTHLEEYNADFAYQLHEFKEGNLLFEIMQRKIWEVAATDSIGLQKYFQAHKNNYWWEASADAIIFTASNEAAATDARQKLQAGASQWKKMVDASNGTLQADSGRFELGQIPVLERTSFTPGLTNANVKNETDNTVSFAYIVQVHREREPRNFADARGFVINDYQVTLENKWIGELKKKYPIVINEAVVKGLPK